MALAHSPRIVTDGLLFYLDAANPKSYPGSGTAWNDLSGTGRNGTLVPRTTGFQFKNENGGILYFPDQPSGQNLQYAYMTTPVPTGNVSYTIHCVFRTERAGGERHIFRTDGNFGCDVNGNRLRYYMTSYNVEQGLTASGTFLANTWYHLTMVYDRDNLTQSIYRNGEFLSSKTHTVQYSVATSTQRWFARNDIFTDGICGDVGLLHFYNRVLTPTEIVQNFNATRSRYGI